MMHDKAESQNVASANPKVVQKPVSNMNKISKKMGVSLMHQPQLKKLVPLKKNENEISLTLNLEAETKKQTLNIIKKEVVIQADYYHKKQEVLRNSNSFLCLSNFIFKALFH